MIRFLALVSIIMSFHAYGQVAPKPPVIVAIDNTPVAQPSTTGFKFASKYQGIVSYTAAGKPAKLATFHDPDFGTVIRRITDVVNDWGGQSSPTVTPAYPTIPVWSINEAYMLLYVRGSTLGSYALLDGKTYAFLRWVTMSPNDLEQYIWDSNPTTPWFIYYINGKELTRIDVRDNSKVVLHAFVNRTSWGTDPMYNYWGGYLALRDETTKQAFVYNLATRTESPRVTLGNTGDGPEMLPSGKQVYWSKDTTSTGGGSFYSNGWVYDLTMKPLRRAKSNAQEHSDNTLDSNGHDIHLSAQYSNENQRDANGVVYSPALPNGSVIKEDLNTGVVTTIIGPANGDPYPPSNTLISSTAYLNRNLAAVGIEGDRTIKAGYLNQEIILFNHVTGDFYRVARHRTGQTVPPNSGTTFDYWGQPNVVLSPNGTRIAFPSDWNGGTSIDTYVVELPGYTP